MANNMISHLGFFVVFVFSCQTLIEAHNGGFSVPLFRHHSRNSPFYKSNSFYQVPQIKSPSQNVATTTRVIADGAYYLMKLTLGTPPVAIYGIIDTGCDLVWTQCKPCIDCYKLKNPMFDPLKSKTYRDLRCNSEQCISMSPPGDHCQDQDLCTYKYRYDDGSMTKGVLALETATFSSSTGGEVKVLKDIVFGCGHSATGVYTENDMGEIGLGRGPRSLLSQMGTRCFSQCLVPLDVNSNVSGTISFGAGCEVSGEGVVTTPLVSGETAKTSSFYLVTLKGISVGNKFVPLNSSKKGNIIIDSGNYLTYIPPEFYYDLVGELKAQIKQKPIEFPPLGFHLCYQSNTPRGWPILTAHFEGADLPLMPSQTWIYAHAGIFCLAMMADLPTNEQSTFGSYAQSNTLIGFNLDRKIVSFKPTDCTKYVN